MFKNPEWEAPVGSINVAELDDDERAALGLAEPEAEPEADEAEDLSKLLKADLVERAEEAGYDTEGLTKAELLEALESEG